MIRVSVRVGRLRLRLVFRLRLRLKHSRGLSE